MKDSRGTEKMYNLSLRVEREVMDMAERLKEANPGWTKQAICRMALMDKLSEMMREGATVAMNPGVCSAALNEEAARNVEAVIKKRPAKTKHRALRGSH